MRIKTDDATFCRSSHKIGTPTKSHHFQTSLPMRSGQPLAPPQSKGMAIPMGLFRTVPAIEGVQD